MAGGAFQLGVRPGERKARVARVIESHQSPAVQLVASVAGFREFCALMVQTGSGVQVIVEVARGAIGAEAGELRYGFAFVAGLAIDEPVGAQKRKPVFVPVHSLH